jgi:hypothetical protein
MSWSGVALGYRAFRLPRQGYNLEECQDALAGDAERGRFALADGAAESPYAALWAQMLVEEFVRRSDYLPHWESWLPSLQERWAAALAELSFRAEVSRTGLGARRVRHFSRLGDCG